ncbi:MAG: hypothetical protein KA146_00835, partial [Leptospiraceae bacterium]|nr:hypothetical protein [Leptospiraceae bacterium]
MAIGSYRRCFLYFMRLHKVALISILFAAQCAGGSYKDKTLDVRDDFYNARFDNSAAKLRVFYQDAANKDKLLYLMEAGVVLHTKGDYETSLKVFKEASDIADSIETSVSGGVASFVLSDNESNFKGESYERVLIKLYLAMNSILLKDYESARKYFKKLNYDQKEIKMDEAAYKENNMARFLDAIISEQLKEYNDARVQYKNILQLSPNDEEMLINRYVLALKENDRGDQAKFGKVKNKLKGFNQKLDPVNYNTNMGELIIINQAGKAPTKESRGKIKQSPEFQVALQSAIEVAARTGGGNISANLSGVLLTLGESENPIPIYKDSNNIDKQPQEIYVNDKLIGNTQTLNDYAKITTTN